LKKPFTAKLELFTAKHEAIYYKIGKPFQNVVLKNPCEYNKNKSR
jgi:hypothetical protein